MAFQIFFSIYLISSFCLFSLLNSTHTNAKQFYNMMVSNKTEINMSDSDEDLMNNMYNALFQCFGIIITG